MHKFYEIISRTWLRLHSFDPIASGFIAKLFIGVAVESTSVATSHYQVNVIISNQNSSFNASHDKLGIPNSENCRAP
jgi:hypothetical protein